MTRTSMNRMLLVASTLTVAAFGSALAYGQQPADDPFAPPKATQPAPAATQPAATQPAPAGTQPPAATQPKPPVDDPFAPMPAQPAPRPPIIPPPQPSVRPVPATPNPAPVIPVPVNPAPVNPAADGENYGPPGTTVIIVASPGGYRYPWGNTGGTWVPFYYNKQWHLYRSWCP